MSRAFLVLTGADVRRKAVQWVQDAPAGTRLTFQAPRRTLDQNSKLWASLTDIATQVRWHGQKLSADDWKCVFLSALKAEVRIVPNLDGNGFVQLGRSSSDLSKSEFSELLELILAWGAQHGIVFHDRETEAVA